MEASVASLGDPIADAIERDLASAREKLAQLQAEDAAWGPGHVALVEVENALWDTITDELGIEVMADCPTDVLADLQSAQRAVDSSRKREAGLMANIAHAQRKIVQFESPAEYDRRVTVKVGTTQAKERSQMAKETAKDQGVPEVYLNTETGNFKIGMDARYKSDLVNSALGLEGVGMLQKFEVKDAEARLAKRDWTSFLTRKKEIIAEKASKAETAAKAKEEAARVKAEEKAAAKAKKDAEKAEAAANKQTLAQAAASSDINPAAGDTTEVTPDTKSGGSRKK